MRRSCRETSLAVAPSAERRHAIGIEVCRLHLMLRPVYLLSAAQLALLTDF